MQIGGGASRLAPALAARIEPGFGCRLQQVWGRAEGLLTATRLDDPRDVVLGTQGRPVSPADEIRIDAPEGNLAVEDCPQPPHFTGPADQ
jgi:2,3-dihydroxybenzoate-AMP ligase